MTTRAAVWLTLLTLGLIAGLWYDRRPPPRPLPLPVPKAPPLTERAGRLVLPKFTTIRHYRSTALYAESAVYTEGQPVRLVRPILVRFAEDGQTIVSWAKGDAGTADPELGNVTLTGNVQANRYETLTGGETK